MENITEDRPVLKKDLQGVAYVSTAEERKEFLEFPYRHYADDPVWVPPLRIEQKELLDTKKNPFFKEADIALFLAYYNGDVAGRIAAIHNHAYNRYHRSKTGFFGFFECIDNKLAAELLFRVARDWLRERGCNKLLGPMNPGLLDQIGIQIDGFDYPPSIMMPHSKPWYDDLIRSAGLEKEMDLFAYKVDKEHVALDRMNRAYKIVTERNPGLSLRPVNLRKFKREVEIIHHIFNEAWKENWGFYEISMDVLSHLGKGLKMIVDTNLAHIAEIDGKPIAFSITLPDYNQVFAKMNGNLLPGGIFKLLWYRRKIDNVRTALMGVLPEYQGQGIYALMVRQAIVNGLPRGYTSAEMGWLLENNSNIIRVVEKIGGVREKTYRMYGQDIT